LPCPGFEASPAPVESGIRARAAAGGTRKPKMDVPAPMAGSVKEILVAAGERVDAGQELLILESMKMEIPVESPSAGTIAAILVEPPQVIDEGDLLLQLDAD
jgi:acetyl-CoA carboxylase biotin carboxyl carrier protein